MPEFTRTIDEISKAYAQYRPENRGFEPGGVVADVLFLLDEVKRLQNKWISVDERLPEPGICVLAIEIDLGIITAYKKHNGKFWIGYRADSAGGSLCEVTHWMPLPEPPEVTK